MSYRRTRSSDTIAFTQTGTGAVVSTVEAKFAETYSVTDFGAVGDGVSDDIVPIQNALDAMGPGDTLLFPNGLYLISGPIDIIKSGITLKGSNSTGDGPLGDYGKGPIIVTNLASGFMFLLDDTYSASTSNVGYTRFTSGGISHTSYSDMEATNVTFDGLQFTSIAGTHTGTAIDAVNANSFTVRNCTFFNLSRCIVTGGETQQGLGNGMTLIENCSFIDCNVGTLTEVIGVERNPCTIKGCEFSGCDGRVIGAAAVSSVADLVITGNQFNSGNVVGGFIDFTGMTSGNGIVITDNNFTAHVDFPRSIIIDGLFNWIIAGNTFRNSILIQIEAAAYDGLITGNIFQNIVTDSDVINNRGDRVTITGNHMVSQRATDFVVIGPSGESNTVGYNTYLSETGAYVPLGDAISVDGNAVDTDLQEVLSVGVIGETATIEREEAMLVTSGGVTISLPSAVSAGSGMVVHVKDRDGNATGDPITVDTQGAETIDGLSTFLLETDHESASFMSDGSNWSVL